MSKKIRAGKGSKAARGTPLGSIRSPQGQSTARISKDKNRTVIEWEEGFITQRKTTIAFRVDGSAESIAIFGAAKEASSTQTQIEHQLSDLERAARQVLKKAGLPNAHKVILVSPNRRGWRPANDPASRDLLNRNWTKVLEHQVPAAYRYLPGTEEHLAGQVLFAISRIRHQLENYRANKNFDPFELVLQSTEFALLQRTFQDIKTPVFGGKTATELGRARVNSTKGSKKERQRNTPWKEEARTIVEQLVAAKERDGKQISNNEIARILIEEYGIRKDPTYLAKEVSKIRRAMSKNQSVNVE